LHLGEEGDRCRRAAERRRKRALVLKERRTGFDRRGERGRLASAIRLLRDDPVYLAALLLCVNLLNLADLMLTTQWLALGIATEGNPLMATLFNLSPDVAATFKVAVVALVSVAIWRRRQYRRFLEATLVITFTYSAVILYHAFASATVL